MTQKANDKQEVGPALEEIKETTDDLPDRMILDNGYMSGDNLESFDGKDIDVYVATGNGEKTDQPPIEDSNRKIKKLTSIMMKINIVLFVLLAILWN